MGLSILERPIGVGLGSSQNATIEQDYAGIATVKTLTPHNIPDGYYVYVKSYVEDYNGFWQIHFVDGYHFFLKRPNGVYVAYIVDTTATIYPETFTHGWSCVELPIVYKLTSDRFPVNNYDIPTTINAYAEQDGYMVLELNDSIPCDTLEYLQIIGGTDGFAGVYQILDMFDSNTALINLKYTTDFVSLGHTVTKYYSNYHAKVNVYAGLNAAHTFQSVKPYELAATLSLIPDSNNEIKFSISDIVKGYIVINNNLLLASLPNNINAYTNFYIGVIESFDNSDSYTVTTFDSSEVLDLSNFEGTAANSILPFKNVQSGYLTDYIMNRGTAKFLTLFAIPTLFSGCYQDVSFVLNNKMGAAQVPALSLWFNGAARGPATWTLGNSPHISLAAPSIQSVIIEAQITKYNSGGSYTFSYDLTISGSPTGTARVRFFLLDNSETTLATTNIGSLSAGGLTGTVTLVPSGTPTRIGMSVDNGSSGSVGVTINTFLYNGPIGYGFDNYVFRQYYFLGSVLLFTKDISMYPLNNAHVDTGIHRMPITSYDGADNMTVAVLGDGNQVCDTLNININNKCANQTINLTWLNNLAGFDYWTFTAFKTYSVNISDAGETTQNLFPAWPKSYGETASSITKQTFRNSKNQITVNSQHLTLDELSALQYIKSSVLVEIINDRFDKRQVIVDKDSFVSHIDNDKLHTLSFTITYTDEIPAQRV